LNKRGFKQAAAYEREKPQAQIALASFSSSTPIIENASKQGLNKLVCTMAAQQQFSQTSKPYFFTLLTLMIGNFIVGISMLFDLPCAL
jgi:hypothetical protein